MADRSRSDLSAERYRLFIAIPLPDRIKDSLETTQSELRARLPATSIRWTRRDQFHLTLRFLGSVEAGQVDRLNDAVRRACSGSDALQLSAAGLGVFPAARRPRVVWVGLGDRSGRLTLLQRAIETATSTFTNEPPQDTFTGHVTLARCRDIGRGDAAELATLVASMASRSLGGWTADSVEIIRSETAPTGSRYTTLAIVALG